MRSFRTLRNLSANFSVDIALIEELGQKLVPRKFTALSELIKNSYDADATKILLNADSLEVGGTITLLDNGTGISPDAFLKGFLRVATGLKRDTRKSMRYGRTMAGSKGVGRFAARMLSDVLEIDSTWADGEQSKWKPVGRLRAKIEWDRLNCKSRDLTDVQVEYQISTKNLPEDTGTVLTLKNLRERWSNKDKEKLGYDLHFLRDPFRPKSTKDNNVKQINQNTLKIECEGGFETLDFDAKALYEEAWGVLRLGWDESGNPKYTLEPISFKKNNPRLEKEEIIDERSTYPENFRPKGKIYLYTFDKDYRAGLLNIKDLQTLGREYGGIRVYYNSFRVYPYGEPGDDWVGITADVAKRKRETAAMNEMLSGKYDVALDKALLHVPSANRTFGKISIWEETTPALEVMVSREGFKKDENFDKLVEWVRRGVHWGAVVYYKWSSVYREERENKRLSNAIAQAPEQFREAISEIDSVSNELRKLAKERRIPDEAIAPVAEIIENSRLKLTDLYTSLMTWGAILRVLASRGLQLSSFAHEFRTSQQTLDDSVSVLKGHASALSKENKKGALEAIDWIEKASDRIRMQVESFLVPMSDIKKERRRRRLLKEVVKTVVSLYEGVGASMGVTIDFKGIKQDIRTIPIFSPELESVIGNLISNAVKFSGKNGEVSIASIGENGSFCVENTGVEVNIKDSEKWFSPFESSSIPHEYLGTGTGLGLAIVRDILNQYQAEIIFKKPSQGFKTRIEVLFP